jgi:hypothetical protein
LRRICSNIARRCPNVASMPARHLTIGPGPTERQTSASIRDIRLRVEGEQGKSSSGMPSRSTGDTKRPIRKSFG